MLGEEGPESASTDAMVVVGECGNHRLRVAEEADCEVPFINFVARAEVNCIIEGRIGDMDFVRVDSYNGSYQIRVSAKS